MLAISWGVYPFLSGFVDSTDQLFAICIKTARAEGVVQTGQTVVLTAGVPVGKSGSTNIIKAQTIGEAL
ncbi:Pyruvate kinase [bioreactor metagenome]|uniref:Pyruvate kinase n=1 Tax=bioreactor metagenome TaxID=1076179 RepID=A0A645HYD6_9ZZZZ